MPCHSDPGNWKVNNDVKATLAPGLPGIVGLQMKKPLELQVTDLSAQLFGFRVNWSLGCKMTLGNV